MKCVDLVPGLKCPSLRHTTCASLLVHSESVIVPHVPEMKISTRPSHWYRNLLPDEYHHIDTEHLYNELHVTTLRKM